MKKFGYVVVTPQGPKDGGDFGPFTEGTKTAGIQEALNYAKANRTDVYICGGAMPKAFEGGAVYRLEETLRIPWMQDFRLDGGEYNLVYTKPTGEAVVFDSQMNCRYKLGKIISTQSAGAVVALRPETRGPDNFCVITASIFEFNVVVGAGGAWPGEGVRGKGTGILLDASAGGVHYNRISAIETVGCDKGVHLKGRGVASNEIEALFSHICNTHLQLGDAGAAGSLNRVTVGLIDSEGISGSVGVDIFGQRNLLTVNVVRTAEGKNIVFEPEAKDNLVFALNLPDGITNRATSPTNRIIPCSPVGFNIPTPALPPSGEDVTNRHPYPVDIMILTAGKVSDWTLTDAAGNAQTVSAGLHAGQRLTLEPGDRIRFTYEAAPTWRWKALT